jgi:hypothetical protein
MTDELEREIRVFAQRASENQPQGKCTQSHRATEDQQGKKAAGEYRKYPQTCKKIRFI